MITLLGVGHVFLLGPRIDQEMERRRPDLIALELDPVRLQALRDPGRVRRTPGVYGLLAAFQRRIAEEYGAEVGGEMLAAYRAGNRLGIPVALIDLDSRRTWRDFLTSLRPWEFLKLFFTAVGSIIVGREEVEEQLHRYQEDYDGFMEALARDYPAVKEILVDRRNSHMANELKRLHGTYDHIVAIVGDGHVLGLSTLLEGEDVEVVRLWELREPEARSTQEDT